MKQPLILFALSLFSVTGFAEESEQVFYSDRWKENYQYLARQTRKIGYDNIKYLPLFNDSEDVYLSLGGNFRERLNSYDKDLFGLKTHSDGQQLLHLFLVHADLHASEYFRAFVQLGSYLSNNIGLDKGPFENDSADLQQGFVDLRR